MLRFISNRTMHSILSLMFLITAVFFLARLTGDPAAFYLPIDATAAMRQEFAAVHGLDQPLIIQFRDFVAGILRLDFGNSLWIGAPALPLVLSAYPTTLILAGLSMSLALIVGIVAGALAAWRPGGVFDRFANLIALVGVSAPNFWVAVVGILFFSVWLQLLPTSGTGSAAHWVLPVAVLFLRPCGLIVQVARNSMIGALSSPYVKTARAKGVPSREIIFVHALRNAMLPIITVAGDEAAGLINGAVIIETVFGLPGVGKLLIDSAEHRDFALLQATVLITAAAIFLLNILIDIAYALLDPRIRHG